MADVPVHRFHVAPTLADWTAANWLLVKDRWLYRRLLFAFLALWAVYAAILIGIGTYHYGWSTEWAVRNVVQAAIYAVAVIVFVVLLTLVLLPRRVKKQFDDVQRLTKGSDIEFDANGLRTNNAIGGIRLEWRHFKRLLESSQVAALMITDREMIVVPKASVDEATLALLRDYVEGAKAQA